jgi:hypothetical protein
MRASHRGSVLVVGMGDLGRRIVSLLATRPEIDSIVAVSRSSRAAMELRGIDDMPRARCELHVVDAFDQARMERLIHASAPAILLHCASLLSPWWTFENGSATARLLGEAGFGAQLALQLPVLLSVASAAREVGFAGWFLNASYPDVTHAALAPLGLAPHLGIGNIAFIAGRVLAALRRRGDADPHDLPVRVIAHHAHVRGVLTGKKPSEPDGVPWVRLGEAGRPADDLAFEPSPLALDRSINALSALDASDLVATVLGDSESRRCCPGPLGKPGGYPVRIAPGRREVTLDLPPGVGESEAVAFVDRAARREGIHAIDGDGTVHFTATARTALERLGPGLGEPLEPRRSRARAELMLRYLGVRG